MTKKMVLVPEKLIISDIQPAKTVNMFTTTVINCKTCKATFPTKSSLVEHISVMHPSVPLQTCTFCNKKFLLLRGLAQHIKMRHTKIESENAYEDLFELKRRKNGNQSYFSTQDNPAVYFPKTRCDVKDRNKDNFEFFPNKSGSTRSYDSKNDSTESSVIGFDEQNDDDSLYSSINSVDSNDSLRNIDFNIPPSDLGKELELECGAYSNSTIFQEKSHYVSETKPIRNKTVSLLESGERELMSMRRKRNGEKSEAEPATIKEEIFPDTLCCNCLHIMSVTKQMYEEQQHSKDKCQECPFCETRFAEMCFDHHIATVHLTCEQQGCESRYIQTGCMLRELLSLIEKITCTHFNCNHKFIESQTLRDVNNIKGASSPAFQSNKGNRECDTTEAATSSILSGNQKNQRVHKRMKVFSNEPNPSGIKFSVESDVKETDNYEEKYSEENEVSSSSRIDNITSKNTCFDKTLETIKIESNDLNLCCCLCKEIFQQKQKLLRHLFNCHRLTHPFTCDICFSCYKNMGDLQVHINVHGKQLVFENMEFRKTEIGVKLPTVANGFSLADSSSIDKVFAGQNSVEKELRTVDTFGMPKIHSLSSDKSNEVSTDEPSVEVCSLIEFYVPKELSCSRFECAGGKSISDSDVESSTSFSPDDCKPAEVQWHPEDDSFKNVKKDSDLKKRKLKISCVVENVEFPLDIHNLYANIQKADDSKVDNSLMVLQTNFPKDNSNGSAHIKNMKTEMRNPVEANASLREGNLKRRKSPISLPVPPKKMKDNDIEADTEPIESKVSYKCNFCEKSFDSKKSYSAHMFFMHDAIFDDSVVYDLLRPSSKECKKIKNSKQNPGYKTDSSISAVFQSTETEVAIRDSRFDIHGDDSLVPVRSNCEELNTVNIVNSHVGTKVETFSCQNCEITFNTGLALREHHRIIHSEFNGQHSTQNCETSSSTDRMLRKNKHTFHSDTNDTKLFNNETMIKSPQTSKVDNTQPNEILTEKDRVMNSEKPLSANKKSKGKINSLSCPICKYVLPTSVSLKAHLMVNHSKVTECCVLCDKLFAFGRGIRHMLDFHIVPTCNQKKDYEFSWEGDPRMDVKEAIEVLGERRLLAICNYDDHTTLKDSASFQCRLCLLTYSAVRYYRNHYFQQHDKTCSLCDQNFESNKDFILHVGDVHNSMKNYLWFTETFITTLIKIERGKENSSDSFKQLIERRMNENEAEAASQLLERMEDERTSVTSNWLEASSEIAESAVRLHLPESELLSEVCEVSVVTNRSPAIMNEPTTPSCSADILELPDFCMEYEITTMRS